MTTFIQLHFLTSYPPANLNRDDTGRPKTAQFGNVPRLRVSSQALKRAWRTSDHFQAALEGHLGERTQRLGKVVLDHLQEKGASDTKALAIARQVAELFGKLKGEKDKAPTYIEQLAFISPAERRAALELAERLMAGEESDQKKAGILRESDGAVDIAMFGRMLAADPSYNREAAVQVAHALTTHRVVVEEDYYTAVDDLKRPAEDAGAGFVGEAGFGAGLFYLYLCIDRDLLVRNLNGEEELARRGIAALVDAVAKVGPKGKQASFASRAHASYALAEYGTATPRTLATAFLKPINGEDLLEDSVKLLRKTRDDFAKAYGEAPAACEMQVGGQGSLAEVIAFAAR